MYRLGISAMSIILFKYDKSFQKGIQTTPTNVTIFSFPHHHVRFPQQNSENPFRQSKLLATSLQVIGKMVGNAN